MKKNEFELPIYDYDIQCIIVEDGDTEEDFSKSIPDLISDDDKKLITERILSHKSDGFTFIEKETHFIVMILSNNISDESFFNAFNHEKRHVVDEILRNAVMQDEMESAAYIDGYISKMFYRNIERLRRK